MGICMLPYWPSKTPLHLPSLPNKMHPLHKQLALIVATDHGWLYCVTLDSWSLRWSGPSESLKDHAGAFELGEHFHTRFTLSFYGIYINGFTVYGYCYGFTDIIKVKGLTKDTDVSFLLLVIIHLFPVISVSLVWRSASIVILVFFLVLF